MLTELHVENFGVIADLSLVLGPGLTVLTGETGAGKTMVIEAIELLMGGRADPTLLRPGANEARVEGRFLRGDDETIMARVVPADGRSRAYLDGRLATAGILGEEGSSLVDLHGQHSHQSLLSVVAQRAALDRYGSIDLSAFHEARAVSASIQRQLADLGGDSRARAREIDMLQFQVRELEAAALSDPDEDQHLDGEETLLGDAVAHQTAGMQALSALTDDDGALDQLRLSLSLLVSRTPFAALDARLRGIASDIDDVTTDLRSQLEAITEDPERLAEIRQRRQLLRDLRRKYGDTLADVLREQVALGERLAELERHDERVAELERELSGANANIDAAALRIAAARRSAAPKLAADVQRRLRVLALAKARIDISVTGDGPADDVVFQFGANPGEAVLPLAKVASGGELARIMLALRLVLTGAPDTLVFDEVDAGIGGEAALAVGRALADLGQRHQVLVVTHLAQVAAFADTHVMIRKATVGKRTVASAACVIGDERVTELSRMLSGLADSSSAHEHAAELLQTARNR